MTFAMRYLFITLLALAVSSPAAAITRPILAGLEDLLAIVLPGMREEAAAARAAPTAPSGALAYAIHRDVQWSSRDSGRWLRRDGASLWRLRVHSEDALSLSLTLNLANLPAGTTMRMADAEGVVHYETALRVVRPDYQTPIVPGDTLVLEMEMPDANDAEIRVNGIQHGYRDIRRVEKSGSCNIDTVCPQGDAWGPQIRATARITVNGTSLCTGTLLNNTLEDSRPLLLTADHCGLTARNARSTVVYWNYETSSCGGSPDGQLRQSQTGAVLLSSNSDPDFALLELDDLPAPAFNVYFAGWDSRGGSFPNGAGIHHPRGDEKRISLFRASPRKTRALVDGEPVQSWEVFWNEGVTEPGSSGSALFDNEGRVVGQLAGGNSSCEAPGASDVYGRLDYGWNTSADASEQLQTWLDAAGTGLRVLGGREPSVASSRAVNDQFVMSRRVNRSVPLTVLDNDGGARPLRILSASSSNGQVEVVGPHLRFTPDSELDAVISYVMIDRNGETSTAQAVVRRSSLTQSVTSQSAAIRGGVMPLGSMLLTLLLFGLRRKRPC